LAGAVARGLPMSVNRTTNSARSHTSIGGFGHTGCRQPPKAMVGNWFSLVSPTNTYGRGHLLAYDSPIRASCHEHREKEWRQASPDPRPAQDPTFSISKLRMSDYATPDPLAATRGNPREQTPKL